MPRGSHVQPSPRPRSAWAAGARPGPARRATQAATTTGSTGAACGRARRCGAARPRPTRPRNFQTPVTAPFRSRCSPRWSRSGRTSSTRSSTSRYTPSGTWAGDAGHPLRPLWTKFCSLRPVAPRSRPTPAVGAGRRQPLHFGHFGDDDGLTAQRLPPLPRVRHLFRGEAVPKSVHGTPEGDRSRTEHPRPPHHTRECTLGKTFGRRSRSVGGPGAGPPPMVKIPEVLRSLHHSSGY